MKSIQMIFMTIFLKFCFLQASFACPHGDHHSSLDIFDPGPLQQLLEYTDSYFAVNGPDVQNAPCRTTRSLDDILNILTRQNSSDHQVENYHLRGLHFQNQDPELLEAFFDLVTLTEIGGIPKEDHLQPDLSAAAHCRDVICASRAIFGERVGPKLLFLKHQFGMNGSDIGGADFGVFRPRDFQRLTPREINSFIRALDDLPPHLLPLERSRTMARVNYWLPGLYADAVMNFFDSWGEIANDGDLDMVVAHELGHVASGISGNLQSSLHNRPEWLALSGWEDHGDDTWIATSDDVFVSRYARTNPAEDFAETFTAYRYTPKRLMEVAPEKYQFMKTHVFGGIEYLSEQHCQNPPALVLELDQMIQEALGEEELSSLLDMDRLRNECAEKIAQKFDQALWYRRRGNFNECIVNHLASNVLAQDQERSELERQTLARQFVLTYQNQPDILSISPTEVQEVRNNELRYIQSFYEEAFITNHQNLRIDDRVCRRSEFLTFMENHSLARRYDSLTRHYLIPLETEILQNFCDFHQNHPEIAQHLDEMSVRYIVTQSMRERYPISQSTWDLISQLENRRIELLEQAREEGNPMRRPLRTTRSLIEYSIIERQLNEIYNNL